VRHPYVDFFLSHLKTMDLLGWNTLGETTKACHANNIARFPQGYRLDLVVRATGFRPD
jgi:hypothetical protein